MLDQLLFENTLPGLNQPLFFQVLPFLNSRENNIKDDLIVEQFISELVHIHDDEVSFGIAHPQLPIIIIERLNEFIDLCKLRLYLRSLCNHTQIHQPQCSQVLVVSRFQKFDGYLFRQIHLQHFLKEADELRWLSGPTVRTPDVLQQDGLIDEGFGV